MQEILQRLGIEKLNEMQKKMCRMMTGGHDIVLLSPTGSGKTLAFLLPLTKILAETEEGLQAVIVAPSRELAIQIESVFHSMKTPFRSFCCHGGRPATEEYQIMKRIKPQLIVTTPGRWCDHIRNNRINCHTVSILILDEFDKSLEFGFRNEMKFLITHLPNIKQNILTSATTQEHCINSFLTQYRNDTQEKCIRLDYIKKNMDATTTNADAYIVHVHEAEELSTLNRLLRILGSEISMVIFVNYKEWTKRLSNYLSQQGFNCAPFHGDMDQEEREKSLFMLKSGVINILVSTDLLTRGIDIHCINAVIHFHPPIDQRTYIHRCGRSGRGNMRGQSFFFLHDTVNQLDYLNNANEFVFKKTDPQPPIAHPQWTALYIKRGKNEKINKGDIVGFLCKKGGLESKEIGMIEIHDHCAYVAIAKTKAKELLERIKGEKIKKTRTIIEIMKNN